MNRNHGHFSLYFLGVGNAAAIELGTAACVLEYDAQPWLLIDCGHGTIARYVAQYAALPPAIFITHTHLDHIADLERLFYQLATATPAPPLVTLFIPLPLVALLHRRLAEYPNPLAEGGCNFWAPFQLIPVSDQFWLHEHLFHVFPVRHHGYHSAFGLALTGVLFFSGDTRPIPELLNQFASHGECICHDCGLQSNPAHTGVNELKREYRLEQRQRLVLYHYESEAAGIALAQHGYRRARCGERLLLPPAPRE